MAERRMFAKTIIDSDAFIDMPVTSRLLYYDLSMRADDDGFVNSPKKIMRMIGASETDLALLCQRKFLIPFEKGIVVIKHWRIHNYLRNDRYKPTPYQEEYAQLEIEDNKSYRLTDGRYTAGIPSDTQRETQDRLGKDSQEEDIEPKRSKRFVPPTVEEVSAYCRERKNNINPAKFVAFYESKAWMVGKNKMKDWKAAIRNWEQRDSTPIPPSEGTGTSLLGNVFKNRRSENADSV